jgi:hypothetical protein
VSRSGSSCTAKAATPTASPRRRAAEASSRAEDHWKLVGLRLPKTYRRYPDAFESLRAAEAKAPKDSAPTTARRPRRREARPTSDGAGARRGRAPDRGEDALGVGRVGVDVEW